MFSSYNTFCAWDFMRPDDHDRWPSASATIPSMHLRWGNDTWVGSMFHFWPRRMTASIVSPIAILSAAWLKERRCFCRSALNKEHYTTLNNGRQTLFRQTLFRQTLFRQLTVRSTQYSFSTLIGICRNSRNWDKIGWGLGVACIDSMSLIQAARWPRGVGPGEWGGYSGEVWGAPSSGKVTAYLQGSNNCTALSPSPLIFGIWFDIFLIGTARRPIQLQSATRRRRPDYGLSE